MDDLSEMDAGEVAAWLAGVPDPDIAVVHAVLRLCEIVDQEVAERRRLERVVTVAPEATP